MFATVISSWVLILMIGPNASPVRVGGFQNSTECAARGQEAILKIGDAGKFFAGFVCIPVDEVRL